MDNVALLKEGYAHFAAGDIPAAMAVWDPKIEWHESAGMPMVPAGSNGIFIGHQAVLENVLTKLPQYFDGFGIEIDEIFGAGDRAVMSGHYVGTLRATGKPFRAAVAHVWTFRNGMAVKMVQIADTAEIMSPKN